MRGLGLKDIIEYIVAAIVIVVLTVVLIFFYGFYETEQYNTQSYEIFYQSLLVDRLNYCLYKFTGNPYYLFYAPTNSTINKYWNDLQGCFMEMSGFFAIPIKYYNQSNSQNFEYSYTVEYANITYDTVPYFIFYDINNLSDSYVFFYNKIFGKESYNYIVHGREIEDFVVTTYVSPPNTLNIQNDQQLFSLLSQYLINVSNYTYQLIENVSSYNNTFIDFYNKCVVNNYNNGVFIFPSLSKPLFEVNYNGMPVNIGVYQFGHATSNGIYNMTCTFSGGQTNCKVYK